MYEQFTKEQLAEQADNARHIAVDFAAQIYRYIAGDISKDELHEFVKNTLSPNIEQQLYHKIIKKDFIDIYNDMEASIDDSDIDELNITERQ